MSCCSKIGEVLKSLVKALKPILAVALVAFAAYAVWVVGPATLGSVPALSWMPATILGMSGTTAGYIALGAALIVDGDTIANIGGELAEGVGEVAGAVIGGIGAGLVSSVTSSSFLPLLIGGAIFWFFWLRDDRKEEKDDRKEGDGKEGNPSAYSTPQPAGRERPPASSVHSAPQPDGRERPPASSAHPTNTAAGWS